ncbi:MAG: (2Fe-2S) ferredoxin domain-containing protein [Planctomycetota bacterium]
MPDMTEPKVHPSVPYERHAFVCYWGKNCGPCGGSKFANELKAAAKSAGITDRVRVNKSGCLNQCDSGPTMVVYPEGIWYSKVTLDDVDEILDRTLMKGEVIERLDHRRKSE